jgi:hypothetical protein
MSALGQKRTSVTRFDDVRYSPKSGHRLSALGCPLCANSGHPGSCGFYGPLKPWFNRS